MGSRGPIPKRDSERRRRNKAEIPTTKVQAFGEVKIPPADPGWHQLARRFYQALKDSAQIEFWEPSDWQAARLAMELLSRELRSAKASPSMMQVIFSALSGLGVTEGDRRRMRIEIDRAGEGGGASVSVLGEYRTALGG